MRPPVEARPPIRGVGGSLTARLLLALAATLLALAAAEGALRLFFPAPLPLAVPDPVLHHVHRPGSVFVERQPLDEFEPVRVRFNALGLREDREVPPEKGPGERRVLVLGDSFVEARQVPYPETMTQQMERLYEEWWREEGAGGRVLVLNGGVSSYSPSLEHLYLAHRGLNLDPDLVVQCFSFNDVTDDHKYRAGMEVDAAGTPLRAAPVSPTAPPGRASLFDLRILDLLALLPHPGGGETEGAGIYAPYGFAGSDTLLRNPLALFEEHYDDDEARAWLETLGHLRSTSRLLDREEVAYLLVALPAPAQVGPDQWKVGKVKWGMEPDDVIQSTRMQDLLAVFASKEGVPYLDLLPAFRARSRDRLFYDYDGHWTAEGNRLAAEEIFSFLKNAGRPAPAEVHP